MRHQKGWKRIISPDVRAVSFRPHGHAKAKFRHVLKPGEFVEVQLNRQFWAPLHPTGVVTLPQMSTRSVLARLGVQAGVSEHQLSEYYQTGKTPDRVFVTHLGETPVRLRKGNRIGRFYFPPLTKTVSKPELELRLERGDLRLDGFGTKIRALFSGMLEISPDRFVFETPKEARAMLSREHWAANSKRSQLMGLLRRIARVPRTKQGAIVLTQTPYIKLPKDLALILLPTTDGASVHIRSLLVDPGFEGPVVLELLGLRHNQKPDNVLGMIVKAE